MSIQSNVTLECMADEPTEIGVWVREQVLGSGGFGVVTLWRNTEKGNLIAVKKCRWGTDSLLTPKHKERWTNEVEIMQRLSHRGVVRALAVPPEFERELRGELPLLCMEYCAHGDLRKVLNKAENCCGLQEPEVRALLRDVTQAVEFLHANRITHRDLKPENIVLQDDENGKLTYKLIDLGYAKELDASSMCASFVGTLQYLAPELFLSKKYSCTVDYWSLGLVAHEIITGVRPFLPNMTPVAWMTHVQRKAADDICGYQNEDGSIVFSKELFPQNHISSCLQYHMEKWLRLLLDWDPKCRGRVSADSDQVLVFSMLSSILDKKVVPVYCVPTSQSLSYEVDGSTELSTLQQWIARDTSVAVTEQELLFPRGTVPDSNQTALQCCIPDENTEWCIYVLMRGQFKLPEVKPRVPPLVTQMIADAKTPVAYVFQKRSWAHAVFFLQQEATLYCNFLRAHKAKLLHVLSCTCELGRQVQKLGKERHKNLAFYELYTASLVADKQRALEIKKPQVQALLQIWCKEGDLFELKINQLEEKCAQLETQAEAVGAHALQLQRSPFARVRISSNLDSLAEAGQQCYEALRRRTKEQRQTPQSHADMARVVYNCLKHRDKLLHDELFTDHLKQLAACQVATEEVLHPVKHALNQLTDLKDEISKSQLQRQAEIWTLLTSELEKQPPDVPIRGSSMMATTTPTSEVVETIDKAYVSKLPQQTDLPQNNLSRPKEVVSKSPPCSSLPVKVNTPSSPSIENICSLPIETVETSSVVQENIRLRHMTQELMSRSFNVYKNLVSLDPAQLSEDIQ